VSTAAATAVAFAVAAVVSFFVPRRVRSLLVVAVLIVPIALAAPRFVRAERRDATQARTSASASAYSTPPPFKWRLANPPLLAGIVEHVPAHASISVVDGNLETGVTRWLAYAIAPRQLVDAPARWTIVFSESPEEAGLHPAHAWRYGQDWVVER
jgi:hypothetical protein